jgi:hypothetical protein
MVHRIAQRARFLVEPPTNRGFTLRLSDVQKNLRGPLQAIQVVTTLDPTANKL